MNPFEKNPFHEAYVTETVPERDFVKYFSPYLVPHVPEVFLPGNVVVKGTQGSGKSMLLRLLDPEIRLAYFNESRASDDGRGFPVIRAQRKFIGARVNLSKAGLLDVTQTLSSEATDDERRRLVTTFGDFFNYWMLRSLLQSIDLASRHAEAFESLVLAKHLDDFAKLLAEQDCFFGYLRDIVSFEELRRRVGIRIIQYRSWTNGNTDLDEGVRQTRTAIGEPLSRAVVCLKECGALEPDGHAFFTIDQIEAFWTKDQNAIGDQLRREIHELMGRRDGRVSFRVGTRRYDWSSGNLKMRDGRDLEDGRDFQTTDIDHLLRRQEHGRWPFADFATDVFKKRLHVAFGDEVEKDSSGISMPRKFFGGSLEGRHWLESLVTKPPSSPSKLLRMDDEWPAGWKSAILACYHKKNPRLTPLASADYPSDPLAAIFLMAWGLQKGGQTNAPERRKNESPPVDDDVPPWSEAKKWWRKERMPQAFLQITARHGQRLYWSGWEHVLSLSASNVLFFVRICREVWDDWRRLHGRTPFNSDAAAELEMIVPWNTQALAIHNISSKMHEVFIAQPGRPAGDVRMRFIDKVAGWLREKLIEDKSLSNPGHNGFSLTRQELEANPELRQLLEEAVGWGDLYEVAHTSKSAKERSTNPRRKFYINPILSPYYQIPHVHTKEPVYNAVSTLLGFARKANQLEDDRRLREVGISDQDPGAHTQLRLFDDL